MSGQFEQHGIVEELVDRYVFRKSLSSPCLQHKFSSQVRGWLRFQRSDRDTFVQWIAGDDLPMMEHGETECLALRVRSQVSLEAETIDCWDECFDGV